MRKLVPGLFLLLGLVLAAPRPALATRIFVPRQHKTIQKAIDAASPGDTVWVGPGVYRGPIVMKKRLTLFADQGPDTTVLDGGDSVRVLQIEGVKNAAVVGFTIRRGHANSGGGIACVADTAIMIATCLIEKNWESGIAVWQSRDIDMHEIQFVENSGSAISLDGSGVAIRDCLFLKNKSYAGGAISMNKSEHPKTFPTCVFDIP